ncbi:MAG TPA: S8 family serine peptidase [bacterium]|jgi:hypothetical protein|nr:S8 family serine peptidase [bacterium]
MADENSAYVSPFPADPVIVVITKPADAAATPVPLADMDMSADADATAPPVPGSQTGGGSANFSALVSAAGGAVSSLFGDDGSSAAAPAAPGEAVAPAAPATDQNAAKGLNLDSYFLVSAPLQALDGLLAQLQQQPDVAGAYIAPPLQPPIWDLTDLPDAPAPAAGTPDFSAHQAYLEAAPAGVDARFAWTKAGGNGAGVQIIDIEGGWRTTHEDLQANHGGVVGGVPLTGQGWVDHGTAVLGVFSGTGTGVTGICPGATVRMVSHNGNEASRAIKQAADLLGEGDIMLLEMHRPGPAANFQLNATQAGFIAVEWWPDVFVAIQYAVNKGIVVIEAAGNGAQNLDDPIYNTPAPGFPAGWSNPFARGARDSGAILVGAGSPPPNTHGKTWAADRARMDFSNYGSAVDVQGWGREVSSTGYGDLQGGADQDKWYTDHFSGTSSASPVVTGVVGCIQGARKAAGLAPLNSAAVRDVLRTTGSPQQDGVYGPATQRIGNRPDLKQILPMILSVTYNANDGVVTAGSSAAV